MKKIEIIPIARKKLERRGIPEDKGFNLNHA
jgi:hypothetical protein